MQYTSEQVQELRSLLKQAQTFSEGERARALLTLAKGKKRSEVAEIFEIHVDTLDTWQTQFKRLGITGIANKGYPGNHYKLTREHSHCVRLLSFMLWGYPPPLFTTATF